MSETSDAAEASHSPLFEGGHAPAPGDGQCAAGGSRGLQPRQVDASGHGRARPDDDTGQRHYVAMTPVAAGDCS